MLIFYEKQQTGGFKQENSPTNPKHKSLNPYTHPHDLPKKRTCSKHSIAHALTFHEKPND